MSSKKLVSLLATLTFIFPFLAQAACGNSKGYARIIDTTTKTTIKTYTGGQISECGSAMGGSEFFKKGSFSVGQFVCSDYCDKGIKPNVQYVQINNKTVEAQKIDTTNKETCIQAKGDVLMYCWGKGKVSKK